jgi:V8-like Glu-specific endopeptidase
MSFEEQGRLALQCGEERWYDANRDRMPADGRIEAVEVTSLPLDLLKEHVEPDELLSYVPENARVLPGAPTPWIPEERRRLRRLDGRRVDPAVFTQIYNGESRRLYRDTTFPWVLVGRLDTPLGSGSAALVGKSTIITASHVLFGNWSPGAPLTANITFTPAMARDGKSALGDGWSARVVNLGVWDNTGDVAAYDMAVCQLDQPFGDWLGYFGAAAYDDDWEDSPRWTHAGYPYDLGTGGSVPCYENGISVFDDDSDDYSTLELETKADIASGQSGGPLWGVFDGHRRIVGVLSGRQNDWDEPKNSLFAGGNGLLNLARWGRQNWG